MSQEKINQKANSEKYLKKMLACHFGRISLLDFIRSQNVSVWWNSEKRNKKLSIAFMNFILSLVDSKCDDAVRYRKEIANNCTPWLLCCKSFMRLAYVEYAYYCEATGKNLMEPSVLSVAFGISKRKKESFLDAIHKRLSKSKIVAKAYSAFLEFKRAEVLYYSLPIKNCAVCATMGAGKSTFINALIGCDVLPSRCEATTAKITSVYDKDGQNRMVGFFQKAKGRVGEICWDVSLSVLDAWNSNKEIVHLFLRGDLDGIGNKGMVVAVHDTPGTNNSSDSSHHKVTLDFLAENKMDLILFVLNAEQLGTSDENSLLREIYSNVVKRSKTDVLFILNKIDSIDPGKESLNKMILDTTKQLEEIGFAKPIVLPVASKAARLLKMKAKGLDTHMTSKERRELALLIHNASDSQSQLLNATGIPCVERRIEEFFTTEGVKQ